MSRELRSVLLKYGITAALAALCVWAFIASHDYANAGGLERWKILCDAFTVPGLIFTSFGGLLWASGEGAFNGVSWIMTNLFKTLVPGLAGTKEAYGDYIARKHGGKITGFGFILHVGLVFLAVAAVFLVLFIKNDPTW